MKSGIGTKKPRLSRRQILKREPSFHLIQEEDLNYYWAAYRKDVFEFPEDLTQEAFREQITVIAQSRPTYTLVAKDPIGVATVEYFNGFAWPSTTWFPWATPREIVETSVHALQEGLRDTVLMFILEDARFCSQMAKYGLLTRAGTLRDKRKIYERRKW